MNNPMDAMQQAYNTWAEQYQRNLEEIEVYQRQALENAYAALESTPMGGAIKGVKDVHMNMVEEMFKNTRMMMGEMRKMTEEWMKNIEQMTPKS
ncbi:MAG: hypothetical protein ACO4AU_11665 [bacterium]|jgi:hypothetical protein